MRTGRSVSTVVASSRLMEPSSIPPHGDGSGGNVPLSARIVLSAMQRQLRNQHQVDFSYPPSSTTRWHEIFGRSPEIESVAVRLTRSGHAALQFWLCTRPEMLPLMASRPLTQRTASFHKIRDEVGWCSASSTASSTRRACQDRRWQALPGGICRARRCVI